ncbi:unnamed protein product [Closterium sp. Naga37s-1]|nr:unnamed protein product [Closterium sp. Naga37s-1]
MPVVAHQGPVHRPPPPFLATQGDGRGDLGGRASPLLPPALAPWEAARRPPYSSPPPPPSHLSTAGAAVGEGMGVASVANPPALLRPARPAALCAPCSSGGGYGGGGCVASPAPPPPSSPTAAAAAEGGGCV